LTESESAVLPLNYPPTVPRVVAAQGREAAKRELRGSRLYIKPSFLTVHPFLRLLEGVGARLGLGPTRMVARPASWSSMR
jgi:hypothetical protein